MSTPDLDPLLAAFADRNQVLRRRALRQLIPHLAVARVRDTVLAALQHDPAWRCRRAAALALQHCGPDPEAIAALVGLLAAPGGDRQVRDAASMSLAAHAGTPLVQDRLLPLLRHPREEVRQRVAATLAPAAATPRVQAALLASAEHDPSECGRAAAIRALAGQLQAPAVWPALQRLLLGPDARPGGGDAHEMVRAAVAYVLGAALAGAAGPPPDLVARSIPSLLAALQDPSYRVREISIAALAPFAHRQAVREALIGLLAAPDYQTRWRVALALTEWVDDPAVAAALGARLAADEAAAVRQQAARALAAARTPAPATVALLQHAAWADPDPLVRQPSSLPLGESNPPASRWRTMGGRN